MRLSCNSFMVGRASGPNQVRVLVARRALPTHSFPCFWTQQAEIPYVSLSHRTMNTRSWTDTSLMLSS